MENRKKILLVSNTAWSIYNFRLGLMNLLKESGFEPVAVAPEDDYKDKITQAGFKFLPLKNLNRKGINPLRDLLLFFELFNLYRREKPVLVIQLTVKPNVYGPFAARLAGIKSVCVITGLGYLFIGRPVFRKIGFWLYRSSFRFAEKIVFLNSDDKDLFEKETIVLKEKSVLIKSSGVNCEKFSPGFCPPALLAGRQAKQPDKVIFLVISRLLSDKGVYEYVLAAGGVKQKYPDCEFRWLGSLDKDNPAVIKESELKDWQKKGILNYLGQTEDVRPFICGCDAVVLPSYREGVPKAVLEAMAMEKPVIAADVPGSRETVEGGKNGFLAKVKNAKSLEEAMVKMIEAGEAARREMGKYSREKALKEFDEKIVAGKYLSLIKEIIG